MSTLNFDIFIFIMRRVVQTLSIILYQYPISLMRFHVYRISIDITS